MADRTRIESIGAYLPRRVEPIGDLLARMSCRLPFDFERLTGIETRRVHDRDPARFEGSFALALAAASDCLARSRHAAADLGAILSTSITRVREPDRHDFEPSFGALLARELGATRAIHFDITNACAGMVTGVYVLDRLLRDGVVDSGLVVSGECITPIAETAAREIEGPRDPQIASLSVGDAGAAVVLDADGSPGDEIRFVELATCAEYAELCLARPSDRGPGGAMYTDALRLHDHDRLRLWPRFLERVLADRGTTFEEERFDCIIQHQVSEPLIERANRAGVEVFGGPMPRSLSSVRTLANTASTSHFVVLHEHLREGRLERPARVLIVPGASGIVVGCLAVTLAGPGG